MPSHFILELPMAKKELIDVIPEDLRILADAYSGHNRVSNRIWLVSATISLIIIGSEANGTDAVRLFGLSFEADAFYPVAVLMLALINVAFCSANMQVLRTIEIIQDRIDSINARNKHYTDNYSLADVVHVLYHPNFKRTYPISRILRIEGNQLALTSFRLLSDVIFYGFPILGCVIGIYKSQLTTMPFIVLCLAALLSIGATAAAQAESINKMRLDNERRHRWLGKSHPNL